MDREDAVRCARQAGHELGERFYLQMWPSEDPGDGDGECYACVHCHALVAVLPATGVVDEVHTEQQVFATCPARSRLAAWREEHGAEA